MVDVVSAGHLCVDISPRFLSSSGDIKDIFTPGKLTNVDQLVFATGGASANVGLALKKLGVDTAIVGKTGTDEIGDIINRLLASQDVSPEYIIKKEREFSSYTIVISPPGVDRIFFHYTGVNDTFSHQEIDFGLLDNARLFHFGYPPIMKKFYSDEGDELLNMMRKAKDTGITTSLDMSLPDPNSPSGKADWEKILSRSLKYVDIFVPSVEELMYMLDRKEYNRLKKLDKDILKNIGLDHLTGLSDMVLNMGCKINVIKCGKFGYYLRTSGRRQLSELGRAKPENLRRWEDRELFSTVYDIENVLSTTGAGDCSIAGFIAALLADYSPEMAVNTACAAGSIAITTYGATDGVVPLDELLAMINKGWKKSGARQKYHKWSYDGRHDLYYRNTLHKA